MASFSVAGPLVLSILFGLTACGGKVEGVDTAEPDADGGEWKTSPPGTGATRVDSGTAGPGTPSTGSSSGGSNPANPSPPTGAGCVPGTSVLALAPPTDPTAGACWSCVAKGCSNQLGVCAGDCACNEALTNELSCLEGGGTSASCFFPMDAADDDATIAARQCVVEASYECSCDESPPLDASTCTQLGGSGGGGNGQCTSTFSEACGGTTYQVVCACPAGNCACFEGTTSTKVVSFEGCPFCPGGPGDNSADDLLTLCGFPH